MKNYVSPHFTQEELECPCCGYYKHNVRLLYSLEKLRRLAGGRPIIVTSACRCEAHNASVGGAQKSRHLTGEAADIVVRGLDPEEVLLLTNEVEAFSHGGIGTYDTFTHLDVRTNSPARWRG